MPGITGTPIMTRAQSRYGPSTCLILLRARSGKGPKEQRAPLEGRRVVFSLRPARMRGEEERRRTGKP